MKILDRDATVATEKAPITPGKDKGFWALNWLRFLLAVYLVLYHTLRSSYEPIQDTWADAALGLGNMATSIFFVLSGFLLMHAYVVVKNGRELNKRSFFVARFSTLYPLHIAGLLLALGPALSAYMTRGALTVRLSPYTSDVRVLEHWEIALSLLMNVTLTNAWNPFYGLFNGPSWSLSALAFFYLVFAFTALKIYRMKSPRAALVLLAVAFLLPGLLADVLHRTDQLTYGLLHKNPILRLPLFLAGMVLCVTFTRARTVGSFKQIASCMALLLATVAIATVLIHDERRLHLIQNGLYFPASLAVIWLCACAKPVASKSIRYWGERLGGASLPLFLLHIPIFALFRKVEQMLTVLLTNGGNLSSAFASSRNIEPSIALYPVFLLLLVALCVLVQERFVIRLQKAIRNRLGGRKEPDAASAQPQRQAAAS